MTDKSHGVPQRLNAEPETIERDLFKLVLTIVELVRQLMERQALRRIDQGDLTDEQIEDLGQGLMRLEQAMTSLRERFDLTPADLNIDLGPLGSLLMISCLDPARGSSLSGRTSLPGRACGLATACDLDDGRRCQAE